MLTLVRTYASFVKLAHTVFALPFAAAALVLAWLMPGAPAPVWTVVLLVLACMVGARSFAMAVNRILDRHIDARNPRTAGRELPAGRLTPARAWVFALAMAGLYFGACGLLGPVVLALSPIPIALMLVYPLTKRFTWACHLVLGASLGLAPVGAWVAARAGGFGAEALGWGAVVELAPWLLGAAVMLWVAGFDVIYALQDVEFDRSQRLHSIPARLGVRGGLWASRGLHVGAALMFAAHAGLVAWTDPVLALPAWAGAAVMIAGMAWQHKLVKAHDLSKVNMAFFTVNGAVSVAYGAIHLLAPVLA
jgi:4-hydroxybenzoate polyprenyltransferase